MIDFQQKKKFNKVIHSKIFFFGFLIVIFFLGRSTYDIYERQQLSATNYAGVKKNYDGIKERKEMLSSEIERLKTDTGIEEEIRGKFNVAKPGETVVTVINGSSSVSTSSSKGSGFWATVLGAFR